MLIEKGSKLGLIAGNRTFPIHVARAARAQGYQVVAVGLKEETEPDLEKEVDVMHWVSFPQIGQVPDLLKKEGVRELILAGQIRPERLLERDHRFDDLIQQLLKWIPDRSGSSAMKLAVHYLEAQGFRVLDSGTFLKDWIPAAGPLTRRAATAEEQADISYGLPLARQISRAGIGQTIVVRRKAVVAVEGMEGTDAAIRRAGSIAGPGCVVVKACGPEHDMRFDIPVVGLETISAMEEAGAGCLAAEAKRTLFFDLPQLAAEADRRGLAIVVV
ncbi:MAG: UDP-2,3-diacylglucosamine diphosphatase LpxI [Candidatus Omnitrophica bacterium]|nr:UDP-2,3-diacylglucosamine diphosphatase LpxI [Candidatus Omnitrophota bacterium]